MHKNKKYVCIFMYVYIHTGIVFLSVFLTINTHIYSQMFANVYVPVNILFIDTYKCYM